MCHFYLTVESEKCFSALKVIKGHHIASPSTVINNLEVVDEQETCRKMLSHMDPELLDLSNPSVVTRTVSDWVW